MIQARAYLNRWDEHVRSVEIHVWHEGKAHTRLVTVSQSTSLDDGSPRPVTVNWAAIGSQEPWMALVMARALEEAVRIAQEMERVEDWTRITPPVPGMIWKGDGMPPIFIAGGAAWVETKGWEVCDAER